MRTPMRAGSESSVTIHLIQDGDARACPGTCLYGCRWHGERRGLSPFGRGALRFFKLTARGC